MEVARVWVAPEGIDDQAIEVLHRRNRSVAQVADIGQVGDIPNSKALGIDVAMHDVEGVKSDRAACPLDDAFDVIFDDDFAGGFGFDFRFFIVEIVQISDTAAGATRFRFRRVASL